MDILTIDNVTKDFGGIRAIRAASCGVPEGAITALIGPNGAGKTTLINMITGVCKPTKGKILFQGRDIQGQPAHKIKHLGIARTFQIVQLFSGLSVLENVQVGAHVGIDRGLANHKSGHGEGRSREKDVVEDCMELLRLFGMEAFAHHMPSELPFGHQRTVELARALVARPRMLILDEPCSGLAPAEMEKQLQTIMKLRDGGLSVLFVEHNMSVVMGISDKIIVLNYGQKIAEGTPAEIKNDPEVIEAYLGEEFRVAGS